MRSAVAAHAHPVPHQAQVNEVFDLIDADGSGSLSIDELKSAVDAGSLFQQKSGAQTAQRAAARAHEVEEEEDDDAVDGSLVSGEASPLVRSRRPSGDTTTPSTAMAIQQRQDATAAALVDLSRAAGAMAEPSSPAIFTRDGREMRSRTAKCSEVNISMPALPDASAPAPVTRTRGFLTDIPTEAEKSDLTGGRHAASATGGRKGSAPLRPTRGLPARVPSAASLGPATVRLRSAYRTQAQIDLNKGWIWRFKTFTLFPLIARVRFLDHIFRFLFPVCYLCFVLIHMNEINYGVDHQALLNNNPCYKMLVKA